MTVLIDTEVIPGHGGQAVDDTVRARLRARMATMLEEAGSSPDDRKRALESLDEMLASPAALNLDTLSAASIADALSKAEQSLDTLDSGIVALGFSLNRRGKGKQCFEMGETRGMLLAARGMLSLAATNILHAAGCECHKPEDKSESETIPPPAPEAAE
jgi:hypothetical protein